jgi:hypothetical protein
MSLKRIIRKYFRGRLKPKDLLSSINEVSIPYTSLQKEYSSNPLSDDPESFILYRILGNDLPPRHKRGQSVENLRFILNREAGFDHCEKKWILNRIVSKETEAELIALLEGRDQSYIRIPFVADEYRAIDLDLSFLSQGDFFKSDDFKSLNENEQKRIICALHRHRNNYVMNNSGARNVALNDGKGRAKWIMPFDGNCFITEDGWEQIYSDVSASPYLKYFVVPMCRLLKNESILSPKSKSDATDEPQIIFRSDTTEYFNEEFPYGRRSKVELFWRLGIPGEWDNWKSLWFDPNRRAVSKDPYAFGLAGWTARLFSGQATLEKKRRKSSSLRWVARQESILALLAELDDEYGVDLNLPD